GLPLHENRAAKIPGSVENCCGKAPGNVSNSKAANAFTDPFPHRSTGGALVLSAKAEPPSATKSASVATPRDGVRCGRRPTGRPPVERDGGTDVSASALP